MSNQHTQSLHPICVDLDNTLLLGDSLLEAILILIKQNPLFLFLMGTWLLRGKAFFKNKIAKKVTLDPKFLKFNPEVINWVKRKKTEGHKLYLTTGAPLAFAEAITNHLPLFDGVLTTTAETNLTGKNKARECIKQFGKNKFIYVGDNKKDLAVWEHAAEIIYVGNSNTLLKQCNLLNKTCERITKPKPTLKTYLKSIRVHQYSKNILILLPIFLNRPILNALLWEKALLALIAFSITCSAVYILNDLYDLAADRQHKSKHTRGFASGTIPLTHGILLFIGAIITSLLLQLALHNFLFSTILLAYFILSLSYSQWIKKIAVLDVMVLTVLYTLRIVAGLLLLNDSLSHWFLSFSIFFFLSLSYLKRYIELSTLDENAKALPRRGYQHNHDMFVKINGLAAGCASIVIFLLYISSTKALNIYINNNYLYIVAFAVFYWLQRVWLLAASDKVHSDPVVFAIKDKVSYVVGITCVVAIILAHIGI